ncbi:DUF485 domain-containing protein [Pseudomonas stutzeri]|uniref:DUF485 domain-containing protein n=1 Tax=Pseudomonas TaxID=286 RepID=UPI0006B8FA7C|nr:MULTISPECIES: DUF485 domain-containing protein [Pseudomonas]MCQ4233233.1 DUF485 domain-containing protein [Stutzerimonas degradans]MDT3710678.1 DUF485 domain-containing protein [Pseudomonadaceae bacterium]MCQ4267266.1 DUF485 domain-containing protein [Stutzerimonas degradans]OOE07952.1 hypothetical protein BSR09_17725 [Stutzerimonas degradans]UIP88409.1 DUF485 domain-containing protein [Pseudomonas phenolilytica]
MHNNDNAYQQIYNNPRFQELVAKRGRFAWLLSIIMLAAYFAFILVIAFEPHLLGVKLSAQTVTTWGIPAGLGLIFLAIGLTGVYVQRANGEFDRINQEILNEAQK